MRLDRALGGTEVGGDFFVQFAGNDLREDFPLTRCQQFKTPPEFALTRTLLKRRRIPLERPLHGGEKVVFAHRLRQEILGAAFHRVDGGGDVPVAG